MSTSPQDFNAQIIEESAPTGGRVAVRTHVSAPTPPCWRESDKDRINPVAYYRDGDRYALFASKAGVPTNPDWYHNLKAHTDVSIEVGTGTA